MADAFEAFWRAMPSPKPAAKASAQAAFAKLEASERPQAILAAGRYAKAFAAKPTTHPISPARFLRERCFEGYGAASPAPGSPLVFVKLDSPQWRAWAAYRGKPIPLNKEGTGWPFPTEWPPGAEARFGAAQARNDTFPAIIGKLERDHDHKSGNRNPRHFQ